MRSFYRWSHEKYSTEEIYNDMFQREALTDRFLWGPVAVWWLRCPQKPGTAAPGRRAAMQPCSAARVTCNKDRALIQYKDVVLPV